MTCKNCIVGSVQFQVKLIGEKNEAIIPLLTEHLMRLGYDVVEKDNYLVVCEEAMHELTDFCEDFGDISNITFTVDEDWLPLSEVHHVFSASWVDTIIKQNRIICYSQPIIQADKTIFGHEVLARFIAENGDILSPYPVFQAAKLRGRLYALDRACRLTAVRYGKFLSGKIFINFIPTSIYAPEFCLRSTEQVARQLNIEPKRFIFEVVETEQVDDLPHLKRILAYYREKGFEYALDDVGEGFSTADLLADLQPHYMKLDRKFVDGVAHNPHLQSVAQFFLEKANEIGATPLAEGIETREDYLYLKGLGYQLFQGYLFSKPSAVPITEIDWQAIS